MLGQGPVPFSHGAILRTSRYLGCYFLSVDVHGGDKAGWQNELFSGRAECLRVMFYPWWSKVGAF